MATHTFDHQAPPMASGEVLERYHCRAFGVVIVAPRVRPPDPDLMGWRDEPLVRPEGNRAPDAAQAGAVPLYTAAELGRVARLPQSPRTPTWWPSVAPGQQPEPLAGWD